VETGDRQKWVDVAKGCCILLVVLYHVVDKQYLPSFELPSVAREGWTAVVMGLVPLRMPLFFLISGFLASRSALRPWRIALGPRVLGPYYLYVVWLLIHLAWFAVLPDISGEGRALDDPAGFLLNLVIATTSLWYLYALAVYFLLAKAARMWPRATLVVAASVNVAVAAQWIGARDQYAALLQNLVFFLAGVYLPKLVHRLAGLQRRRVVAIGSSVVLLVLLVLKRVLDADGVPGLLLLLSALACIAGVSASSWAADVSLPGARLLAHIGRGTLPVYVLHLLFLSLLGLFISSAEGIVLPGGTPGALVYPVVVTAVVTGLSLAARRVLGLLRLGVLLSPPLHGFRLAGRPAPAVAAGPGDPSRD
jgi:threonine dehydratase